MSLDLTPAPGAVALPRMIVAHAAMEFRLLVRNGEQLLLNLIIPALLLVAGSAAHRVVDLGEGRTIDIITPGVLTLAVLSASFTSLAISTGFDRRQGVLKRLGASPLPRAGLMAGKLSAVLLVEAVQLALLSVIAWALGWEPSGGLAAVAWLAVFVMLGTAAFASLGLALAGTLRAEATLALANLIYVVLLIGGAVMIPLSQYPAVLRGPLELLPTTAVSESLRIALSGGSPEALAVVVLVGWGAIGTFLTVRTFRWE